MRTLGTAVCLAAAATVACAGLAACTSGNAASTSTPSASASATGGGTHMTAATSSEVTFDADGTTTYGTLEIPAHNSGQKLAAALLLAGSGPTDRNGNDAGAGVTASTLKLAADLLAKQGIMSLRFDKYFSGQTGGGKFGSNSANVTVNAFFRQAVDGYEFLRSQPAADPNRMLLVGHSEGGMYALVVAHFVTPKPAGIALLEPQDERLLNLVGLQVDEHIDAMVAQGVLTRDEAIKNAHLVQQAIAAYRAGQPVSPAGMARPVLELIASTLMNPANKQYNKTDDQIVPAKWAGELPSSTQVLVTDGTRDPNVPPQTIGVLVDALKSAGVGGPGYVQLQGTDHYMHLPSQPDHEAVLAPAAIAAINQWAHPFATTP